VQFRKAGLVEGGGLEEIVVALQGRDVRGAALHRLEDEEVVRHGLADEVEGQQRVPQVIEHAHEQDDVEALAQGPDVVDGALSELDVLPCHPGGKARLFEVPGVGIEPEHARGPAPLHLDGVEASVATDVQHALAGQVGRQRVAEAAPLHGRIVTEEMVRRGPDALEVDVVEPLAQRIDLPPQGLGFQACTIVWSHHAGSLLGSTTRPDPVGLTTGSLMTDAPWR
jgi:hypothetical protein